MVKRNALGRIKRMANNIDSHSKELQPGEAKKQKGHAQQD